ncbi:MAG: porin family protein [Ferruginibacter sp.]
MKRIVMATMAIAFCTFQVNAQTTSIGFKAGVNIATLGTEQSPKPSALIGLHAGLLAHIHVADKFAVQPEVVYSMQGAKDKSDNSELRLGYLNVPVLVQYMFSNGLRLETGPQAGILLSAKEKDNNVSVDVKNGVNGFDFSWAAGVGYLSKMGLGADARFNFGLSNINKNNIGKLRNNVAQIGLFYQFK